MKNIIILGDSFTYGHGCSDKDYYYDSDNKFWIGDRAELYKGPSKYCWASLLSKFYPNYNIVNLSFPGNDNAYMLAEAYKYVNDNTALVIFAGTVISRMHIPDYNSNRLTTWVMSSVEDDLRHFPNQFKEIQHAKKYFLKYLYSEEMFSIYALNALYAAYGLTCKYNAKFIWSGFPFEDEKHEDYASALRDMQIIPPTSLPGYQSQYRSKDNHMNNLGHAYYFSKVLFPKVKEILE